MDYEKLYKDALERARKALKTCGSLDCEAARLILKLFPQLTESEDERILCTLYYLVKDHDWLNGATKDEVLTWLKQQESLHIQEECLADNSKTSASEDEMIRKRLIEYFEGFMLGKANVFWEGLRVEDILAWLEKQKDIDKMIVVSPEVWDKAISDAYENGKKEGEKQKENNEYVFRPLAGTDITIAAEQAIRRADEGDRLVLAFNGAYIPVRKGVDANKIVDIYDAFVEKQKEQKPKCSAYLDLASNEFEACMLRYLQSASNRKNDFEINVDTKKYAGQLLEIAKKEQHPFSKFRSGDWVVYDGPLGHAILQVKDIVGGRYSFVDNVSTLLVEDSDKFLRPLTPKDVEKPAEWSEEDEEMYARVVRRYTDYEGIIMRTKEESVADKILNAMAQEEIWLKSLLERFNLQPKPEVECDNETEIQKAYREGKNAGRKEVFDHPEEYGLQPRRMYDYETGKRNPEWSEEDEKRVKQLIYDTEAIRAGYEKRKESLGDDFNDELIKDCDEQIKWLKSLRPSWKPSEEQMEALKRASVNEYLSAKQYDILVSLYEQLKKL